VHGWTGRRGEDLLAVFRRAEGPPVLLNGWGEQVAEFPFYAGEGAAPRHFVQHFDILGDGREEILINSDDGIWIYGNGGPAPERIDVREGLPNPRIYNASFYIGMQ
jgi:hypothetical protein